MINTKNKITPSPKVFTNFWKKIKNWIDKTFRDSDPDEIIFSNAQATGTHKGTLTKSVDAALNARRLVTFGKNANSVKICGKAETPIGCTLQDTDVIGEPTTVVLLGVSRETVRIQASADINAGQLVVCSDDGKIEVLPKTSGIYWVVGLNLTEAKSGELVEVATTVPYQIEIK